jgi:peptidylprolyl isomerase
VAQSRRRERELARRRFERRRMAEMQRREQLRQRNQRIGAVVGVLAVLGAVIGIGFATGLFGGGSSNSSTTAAGAAPTGSASASPSASVSPSASSSAAPAGGKCAKVSPNPPAKGEPKVPDVVKAPKKLVVNDIKKGSGAIAKKGDTVTVKYVGVACSTGKAFDASYTDGAKNQEFSFTLGQGSVIPGWDQGIVGMKQGSVRQLVIPPSLAYGSSGQSGIAPNETLNFVVTLDKVKAAKK